MKQWYESLFENYTQKYDKECFVQGTLGECDFIEQELNDDKNRKGDLGSIIKKTLFNYRII